mgnify:CR=1 FL=1
MNKLLIGFIFLFSLGINAEGTFVLNAEGAMLNTQYAKDAFKELEEDSDFVADKERLELLQSEGQELVEKFQKENETLTEEQKLDKQKILIQGYMFPLEQDEKQKLFLLGPFPISCPYHPHISANLIIEVHAESPIIFSSMQ